MDAGVLEGLPEDMRYLIEPALKYGRFEFDEMRVIGFLAAASEVEMQELARVGERVRLNDHYAAVHRFLDRFPITEFPEAARLYCLFLVLDHAGLQFENVADDGTT